ncbi:MAG: HAD family hydrolase [Clostridia bacterium]|nr:HAD family hydrolase [Clostridia bacterium]
MDIKAILFDLDGTLNNTLLDIANAMNRALRLHGLPEYEVDAYRYMVGDGVYTLAKRAVGEHQELADAVRREYQSWYQDHTQVTTRPYEGIPEMLQQLMTTGLKLCVFSNKPHNDTVNVIHHYFPQVSFDVIRGQVDGVPVKPAPDGTLIAAREMGIAPENFLYLGDTSTDMRCAAAAGMHPVGVTWGFREEQELRESGAEFIIHHPHELFALLEENA